MKDFIVNIAKLTKPVSRRGFGLPLMLSTSKEHPYTIYKDIDGVAKDFAPETKEYKIAARIFGQEQAPEKVAIYGKLYDVSTGQPTDLITALNELIKTNNDWYYLICTENSDEVITALAEWVEAQEIKTYFTTTQNLDLVKTLDYEQTVVMYHNEPNAYVAEGLTAIAATNNPGGITLKFKSVKGVPGAAISSEQLEALHADGGFSYISKMGVLQTTEGKTTSGEYIDVVMGAHYLKIRMEEEAMRLATSTPKIPYDNTGISMITAIAHKVLQEGVDMGIILRGEDGQGVYTVETAKREDVEFNDIATRVYNGVSWEAALAGAIHGGQLSGVLTY